MKPNQEFIKYLAKHQGIPETSLERYDAVRPQALQVKDNNIYIDGVIVDSATAKFYEGFGFDMNFVTPENVRNALEEFDTDVTMWINSPGGSVFDASSILTSMMRFQESHKINVVVDGLAASAATYLAVQGDNRKMAKMAMFMIHNSWAFCMGDANDMGRVAATLNKIDQQYADMLADNSNMAAKDIREAMNEETWYTADEAVEAGFMDQVYEPKKQSTQNNPKQSHKQKLTATILALNELQRG